MKRIVKIVLILIAIVLIGAGAGFYIWASNPSGPSQVALDALQSNDQVTVDVFSSWTVFHPVHENTQTGLIFYPGGRVDYRSYAPLLSQIAAKGYYVVLVRMPLNLAVFSPNRAADVIAAFPEIQYWAVGGHSLGGAMAAHFIYTQPETVKGLVLWAAYPSKTDNLSSLNIQVVSISGTLDGLATPTKIDASRVLLPTTTVWVTIEGGDHAQFGSYGIQKGDNPAKISAQEQWNETINATVGLLAQLNH